MPAPPAPVPAPPTPEPTPELDVKAGKERSRREQSEMDRALEAGRGAARAAAGAVDAAEGSAVEATSNASEAVAADREEAGDRAVAAAAGARAHAAGSCRTATATAVDALDKADGTTAAETDAAAAAPTLRPAILASQAIPPPAAVPSERGGPIPSEARARAPPAAAGAAAATLLPPSSTPAVELAKSPAAARRRRARPVAPDEPAPMDTTPPALSDDDDAPPCREPARWTSPARRAGRGRGRDGGTRPLERPGPPQGGHGAHRGHCESQHRPPNVDWRIGHTYSFLGAMHALGADTRAALAEALIRGQRGELEPSTVRRAVARILGGNLRTLERFQHTLRPTAAPIASAATVSWYDPASGVDLYAYSSCGAAAKEWGVLTSTSGACVEGNADGERTPFRRQTRWPVPAGAERVSQGVYRVGDDRYRVQLGHDWGFLGNFDSAGGRAGARSSVGSACATRGASSRRTRWGS